MKLSEKELLVLEWAARDLEERANKLEQIVKYPCSFRREAEIIKNIIERGKNETKEAD